jgi:hypothetical protein
MKTWTREEKKELLSRYKIREAFSSGYYPKSRLFLLRPKWC